MTDNAALPATKVARAPWRRHAARLVLLLGFLFAATQVLPTTPTQQTLEFHFTKPATAGQLTVTWTRDGEAEPAGGITLHFPSGMPKRAEHKVSLPNGRYVISLQLETTSSTELDRATSNSGTVGEKPTDRAAPLTAIQTNSVQRVTLEGGATVLTL